MKKIFNNQEFDMLHKNEPKSVFEDIEFVKCKFSNCGISLAPNPEDRAILRNISMINCSMSAGSCTIRSAILDSCHIENFGFKGTFDVRGAIFRRTTLKGKIGELLFYRNYFDIEDEGWQAYDQANRAFYDSIDWALDISEAEFTEEPSFYFSIPPHLVIRDPQTQVVITKQRALELKDRWVDLFGEFGETGIRIALGDFLRTHRYGGDDIVAEIFAAPKGCKKFFKEYMKGIELLRELKLVEEEPLYGGPVQGIPSLGL